MGARTIACIAALALIAAFALAQAVPPAPASAPATAPTTTAPVATAPADADIAKSIALAKEYLFSKQNADHTWPAAAGESADEATAWAVDALTRCNGYFQDDRIKPAVDWMIANPTKDAHTLALRCRAFGQSYVQTQGKYQDVLAKDVDLLSKLVRDQFDPRKGFKATAVLDAFWAIDGLIEAEQGGGEVAKATWQAFEQYLFQAQNTDDGWGYGEGDKSNFPMTAAALYALQATDSRLHTYGPYDPSSKAAKSIRQGMLWLDKNFDDFQAGKLRGKEDLPACLFYLAEMAKGTGQRTIHGKDIFRACTAELLRAQNADGSWGNKTPITQTAYAMNFLAECRMAPVLLHLQYDGDWNTHPWAILQANRFLSVQLTCGIPMRWCNVSLATPLDDWPPCRLLLIIGDKPPKFSKEEMDKLRLFVVRGGVIFSIAEGEEFRGGAAEFYAKLFPEAKFAACGKDHWLLNEYKELPKDKFKLFEVSNGIRPLAVHCDNDLLPRWERETPSWRNESFLVLGSVVRYVHEYYRNIPMLSWPAASKFDPKLTVKIARLKNAGAFVEPLAYERFIREMGNQYQVKVELEDNVPVIDVSASKAKLAILSGRDALILAQKEKDALSKFVAGGGTLLVEAVGGSKLFAESAEREIAEAFPNDKLDAMDKTDPVLNLKDLDFRVNVSRAGVFPRV